MWLEFLIVAIGCLVIVVLADLIIKKNIEIAEHFGLSGTFIGMTILSIGTSLPEILTHVVGSIHILKDSSLMNKVSSLVIGTNIGSDIFQQNFILSIVAILGGVYIARKNLLPTIGGLIAGAVLLLVMGLNGVFSRWEGIVLVGGYLIYLVYLKYQKFNEGLKAKNHLTKMGLAWTVLVILVGFIGISYAANEVLKAAEVLVDALPISASFFGVIILGIAAALPELTTALVALKKSKGMSAGVLIGSNVTNPTLALGLGAIISTYVVPDVVIKYDLPFKIATAFLILYFLSNDKQIGKKEAIVLIGLFVIYLVMRNLLFPIDF